MLLPGQRNEEGEEVFPESSPEKEKEKEIDPQTPPPLPTHRVDVPCTQPDSSSLIPLQYNASGAPDFKRQNKTALSWSCALLIISFGLLENFPRLTDRYPDRFVLCAATAILECLCFSTALGIVYYSNTIQLISAELAKAQMKVVISSELILLLDFLCRLALRFPFLPFLAITVAVAVLTPLVLFPLHRAHITTLPACSTMKKENTSN